jgi:arylsulfatase A-like enzyme
MTRRELFALAGPLLAAPRKPNLVLIVADDLGWADLGCCGDPAVRTPHLDRMAAEGMRFTNFVVSWPACTPSRSSILTGRHPQRNGLYEMIRNNEVNFGYKFDEPSYAVSPEMTLGLDLREVTIGQVLRSAGYATGVIGKWDSGRARRYLPLQRGFDFFYGFANTGIDYYTHERYGVPSMFRGNERIKEAGHATDLFAREAHRFIEQNRARPFFLYLPFNAPHGASTFDKQAPQVPDEYLKMYGGQTRAQYKALISHMDSAIGGIFARLRDYGLENDTLVVFTSDNGGTGKKNGVLRGGKSSLWEGGLRVPFLARWPGHISKGVVRDDFAATLDLLPTFASVSGAHQPSGVHWDGFDLLPVFEGKAKSARREMFWEHRGGRAARSGQWKWLQTPDGGGGLFDLLADPSEAHDLSQERPEIARMMQSKWKAWRAEMDAAEPRGPFRDY